MSQPVRIRRQRTKGWRMPPGAIYVGRPSRWGNPWRIEPFMGGWSVDSPSDHEGVWEDERSARAAAVGLYRDMILPHTRLATLRGHDLACWCPLDQPCHADVLLELANRGGRG
jgi:hypothetical protein